jgi:asparagine N-glycosylation enzyme membrane subunit Stt3
VGRGVVDAAHSSYGPETNSHIKGAIAMLYTIAVILLIAWLLGFVGVYTVGSFVHVLLVVAIVLFLVGLLSGRRTLA